MQVQNCATEKLFNTANYLISFIYRYEKRASFQFLLDIHIYAPTYLLNFKGKHILNCDKYH